ncbi:SDR family NAD(P)-dependent oxidoreductase [Streptomyces sp. ST2-7A]|uniref:SDR family NAD(P)-dependent oxidoreductase n=1 Tax=Streptomyces sp. ST2-7A TaxID=2907214 RepID=UPI001F202F06|nr:SDR family NAD(P)-dependent oxidoreductase [Streptomyces sp. ST2-7A]MCE7078963.1 SDR family NAD(P)-dependent oxidoreductase [Streptomyces sp. ST2-7A]
MTTTPGTSDTAGTVRRQEPIGSGFGARSTAEEVLRGIDVVGRTAIVTGGYSGIGLETTRALADAGMRVVVPARRPEEAREAVAGLGDRGAGGTVEVAGMDLADLDDVTAFAEGFVDSGRRVDAVINGAGVMACPGGGGGRGWERQFAVNHLGHFVLVNRLRAAFSEDGTRVVSVSSAAHHRSPVRWDDPWFEDGYDKWEAYGQSKTANVLFAVHLDALARDAGVRAFSLHPGAILTPLQRHLPHEEMVVAGWIDEEGRGINPAFKTPEQGAATQVWAATSPHLADLGGLYCEDCDVAVPADRAEPPAAGVADHAVDPGQAERLWAFSAELTGVDAFR